jgi:hypothetical protein
MRFPPSFVNSDSLRAPRRTRSRLTSSRRPRRTQLSLDVLEDRTAPAVLIVSTAADNTAQDNLLTLREAIALVNAAGDANAALSRNLTTAEETQVSGAFGSGDTIGFASDLSGPITLQQGQFVIARAVSITGPAAGLTLDAGSRNPFIDASRIFSVDDGADTAIAVVLSGLTLTGGVATEGGAIVNAEDLSLTGCTLAGNSAVLSGGGGIVNDFFGTVTLTDCTLSGNSAGGDGGGIANLGTVSLTGCALTGNSSLNGFGGGLFNGGIATLTLTNCALTGNTADLDGGGIYNLGTAALANCAFTTNSATREGGGIDNVGMATLTLIDCTLGGNSASFGGGVDNFGAATLTNCILVGNSASAGGLSSPFGGGGIVNAGVVTLTHCVLVGNSSVSGGGIFNTGTATLSGCTLSRNSAVQERIIVSSPAGGGLYNEGTAMLTDCTLSANNSSVAGGGIANFRETTLTRCTLEGNSAGHDGGGIANFRTVTLTYCTLAGNHTAAGWGGGINNQGMATLTACTLSGNSVTTGAGGGGIFNQGITTLTDCTLSGNSVVGEFSDGGGILNWGTVTLTGCTLSGNSADGAFAESGGVLNEFTATLNNTIVANSPAGRDVVNKGTLSGSHSLIEAPVTGPGTNLLTETMTGDPLLGPLQDNGGPTLTHALLRGSPALNAGSNTLAVDANGTPLIIDQRGAPFVRIAGGSVDLGAYEAQSLSLIVDTTIDEEDGDHGPGDLSLREAVALARRNPGGDTIAFAPTVFAAHQTITLALGELLITDPLSITGPAAGLTVDAAGASRIFTVNDRTDATVAVVLSGLTLTNGFAHQGGAIANFEDLSLTSCTLLGNSANEGGGLFNVSGTVTLTDCTLLGNSAVNGGGIFNGLTATLTITNCTLSGNAATEGSGWGGGIFNGGTATLTGCTLSNNSAVDLGGGIFNDSEGAATLTGCTLSGNSATYGGGINNFSTLTLAGCTLSGNSADVDGGGVANHFTATLIGCTLSGNLANRDGGGIDSSAFVASLTIINCTLSGNAAASGGGIENFGAATLNNSIVANSPAGGDVSNAGALNGSHNLIQAPVTDMGTNSLTDTLTGDPLLGPLQDNGGSTYTHALLPGSPALNAGSNALVPAGVSTDQRGLARISGGTVDIGAFEHQAPTVTAPTAQTAFEDVDQPISGITVNVLGGGNLTVTLSVSHGNLTLGTTAGLTVSGNGSGVVTLSGSITDLNASLASLVYRGSLNYFGPDAVGVTASDGILAANGSVAITVKSGAQQASDLQAQVNALRDAGVLNKGRANALLVKLNLKGNAGDIDKVRSFLDQVGEFLVAGILTQAQADALTAAGQVLLTSVRRR